MRREEPGRSPWSRAARPRSLSEERWGEEPDTSRWSSVLRPQSLSEGFWQRQEERRGEALRSRSSQLRREVDHPPQHHWLLSNFPKERDETSARIEMEESQVHLEQKGHQNPLLKHKAKLCSRCPEVEKRLDIWDQPKFSLKQAFFVIGILKLMLLVLMSYNIFLLVSPAEAPSAALCPIPWVGYGEKCYFLSATEANWTHSQSLCTSQGGTLVTMETPEEKDFVQRYREQIGYWIGLRRESLHQPWMRPNGSLFDKSFPIRGEGLCAYVIYEVFRSTWCTNTRYWICSKPAH